MPSESYRLANCGRCQIQRRLCGRCDAGRRFCVRCAPEQRRESISYDSRYADLLFEVVTRRYDSGRPVLLSTKKAFANWGEVFPHAACVVTLIDRLVHRAEVIDIEADSYRLKEAKELNAARSKRRSKKQR